MRNKKTYFENEKMGYDALKEKIATLNPKKDALVIKSDARSQFQNFVKIIDLLKRRGFEKISIETKQ